MHSLRLSANPQGWRHFMSRKYDREFTQFAQQVWQRDRFCCQYCGVAMQTGQEVINVNGQYTQNQLDNLVTACGFCAQCGFLESIGTNSYGGGMLIYLPELSQAHLNGFCYALFAAMLDGTEKENTAQQYHRSLNLRAQLVEQHLGTGMSDPAVLGQLLVETGLQPRPDTLVAHLRLLPARGVFKEQILHWMDRNA